MPVVKNVLIWDVERTDAVYGDIVIDEAGKISAITSPNTGKGEVLFDGKGRCMALPGLVNAHTHVSMTLLRGLGEELPLMEWLQTKIFPVEDTLTAKNIRSGADLAMLEMISGGVTGFVDMYYFMDEVAESVLESGVRAALSRGLMGDEERLAENIKFSDEYNGREGRITVQLGPHAPYTVSRDAIKKIAEVAIERDLGVHFHWLETKGELDTFRNDFKAEPGVYLEETGLLGVRRLNLAHSVWHPVEQLHYVNRNNVTLVHNPKSNLKLGSGYAPIKEFLELGIQVALGTDGAASNNRLDIWDEMRAAALMHKGYNLDPTVASARDILKMATVNGARAMDFEDVGLIKENYQADIIVVDMDNPRYVGCNRTNAPEFVVYAGSSRDVRATIVAGKALYKDGEFLTLDIDKIMSRAREDRNAIDARNNKA
jgi:5-methylthioadenosine/S-adenosylhomocysteine deaminase